MSDRFKLLLEAHLILLDDAGRVLLLRRCNTDYENGSYSLVAGKVEAGEEVTAAAIRETRIVNAEPDKCDDLSWHSIHELPANMVPCIRQGLTNYRIGKYYDGFGW